MIARDATADHITQTVSRRVSAGKVSPVETVKAHIALAQTRAALSKAKSQWRVTRQQLNAAMGEGPASPQGQGWDERLDASDARLPTLGAWTPLEARISASPLVLHAQQEVQRREALTAGERARQIPDMAVSLGVKREAQLGRNQALIGVSWTLPIFDRNQGGVLEASRREDASRADVATTLNAQRTQAIEAFEQLSAALAELQTLDNEVLPGASQALDAITKGYEWGKFGFIDVLDAQRTFFDAKSQALQAASQAFQADARLRALLGEPSTMSPHPYLPRSTTP